MSTKTTKKTTISTSSVSSSVQTPQPGTSSQSQAKPGSPLSPTRYSRLQEKADLQNLNDRLANYIDKVRHLEAENSRLTREVRTSNETTTREVTSVRSMYESELSEARKLLDEVSREKARLELDSRRLFNENQELSEKLDKKSKDLAILENSYTVLEARVGDLNTKYNQSQADRKKLLDEIKNLEKERDKLLLENADYRNSYEAETLKRVDFENAAQTLKEELAFKEQMFQQQILETKTKRQVEISEIDGRLSQEYEEKLYASLQEIREQYEIDLKNNKEDIKILYEEKLKNLGIQMARNSAAAATALDEMRKMSSRMENQNGKINELEAENAALIIKIRELEKFLEEERSRYIEQYARMDREISQLQEEMARQMQEYQDLMDIKVALDLEIAAYRALLEGEESRLNITPASTPGGKLAVPRSTPLRRGTPLRGKRKRTMMEDTEEESLADFSIKSSSKGEVEFQEICPDGKFVKLLNKGNKEAVLGGWQVVKKAGDDSTNFKFHRSLKLEPGATVTIWSADSDQAHEPPSTLVMKGQKWVVGDNTTTTLINTNGEEVAIVERSRQHLSISTSRTRHGSGFMAFRSNLGTEELYHQQGDPQGEERCSIM